VHHTDNPLPTEDEDDWRSLNEDNGHDVTMPRAVRESPTVLVYTHPTLPEVKYARETIKDPATKREGVAIYCYQHGCKKMRRAHMWPEEAKILQWLKDGADLPRSEANKKLHERAFDNLWPAPTPRS
jgi:hypothetical protein